MLFLNEGYRKRKLQAEYDENKVILFIQFPFMGLVYFFYIFHHSLFI